MEVITLTKKELEVLVNALAEVPYKYSAGPIGYINKLWSDKKTEVNNNINMQEAKKAEAVQE